MATPTDLVGLGIKLFDFFPELGRRIASWNVARRDVPEAVNHFLEDITLLEQKIHDGRKWQKSVCELTPLDISLIEEQLVELEHLVSQLRGRCETVRERVQKKRNRVFISLVRTQLEEAKPLRENVVSQIEKLRESKSAFEEQLRMGGNCSSSNIDSPFRPIFEMAPFNEPDVLLDFESDTFEGRLWKQVFSKNANGSVCIVVRGMGGVGKTTAVCGIANDERARYRFPGGVMFVQIGEQGTCADLIQGIALLVEHSGCPERADKIRVMSLISDAVFSAATWFQNRCCLFIFDDLWVTNDIPETVVSILRQIAQNPLSRVLYTTRDRKIKTTSVVEFGPRHRTTSQKMLLMTAQRSTPLSPCAKSALQAILYECQDLPLYISIAGRTVHELAEHYDEGEKDLAWNEFMEGEQGVKDVTKGTKILSRSLAVAKKELGDDRCDECFASLCVVKKGENMCLHVIERLWSKSSDETKRIVQTLERYSIIQARKMFKKGLMIFVSVHDKVLDAAMEMAKSRKADRLYFDRIISSYCPAQSSIRGDNVSETVSLQMLEFRNWWLGVHDDEYIFEHITWLLVCAYRFQDVLWLLNRPKWVINQFRTNGPLQVRQDINNGTRCVQLIDDLKKGQKEVVLHWLMMLMSATQLSAHSVTKQGWEGMAWLQLFGRLQYYDGKDELITEFLRELEQDAPKPWPKPKEGCLPPAGESMKYCINSGEDLIGLKPIGRTLLICCVVDGWVTIRECCLNTGEEKSFEKVIPYDFEHDLARMRDVISDDGNRVAIPTKDGTIVVLERHGIREDERSEVLLGTIQTEPLREDQGTTHKPVRNLSRLKRLGYKMRLSTKLENWMKEGTSMNKNKAKCGVTTVETNCSSSNRCQKTDEPNKHCDVFPSIQATLPSDKSTKLITNLSVNDSEGRGEWEQLEEGEEWNVTVLTGHEKRIQCMCMAKYGPCIVSGSDDCTIRIWEKDRGAWKAVILRGHSDHIHSLCMTDDGRRIIAGVRDYSIKIWEKKEGVWRDTELRGHEGPAWYLCVTADGRRIVSGGCDSNVGVWDETETGWTNTMLKGHEDFLRCVYLSADGQQIVSGSDDHSVRIWKLKDGVWKGTTLMGHSNWVTCVYLSNDGEQIISASNDNDIRIWKNDGYEWQSTVLSGHENWIWILCIADDERQIISGSYDSSVRVWEKTAGDWRCTKINHDRVSSVSLTEDGTQIVVGMTDGSISVEEKGECGWTKTVLRGHSEFIVCLSMSKDGKRIVSSSCDRTVRIWDQEIGGWNCTVLDSPTSPVWCLNTTDDGQFIVGGEYDKIVRIWSHNKDKRQERILRGHSAEISCVSVTNNGLMVVSGSYDNTLRVWEKKGCDWKSTVLSGHTSGIRCLCMMKDGKRIVSGCYGGHVRIWERVEGEWRDTVLLGHINTIFRIHISDDGQFVVSNSVDHTLRVWNQATSWKSPFLFYSSSSHLSPSTFGNTSPKYILSCLEADGLIEGSKLQLGRKNGPLQKEVVLQLMKAFGTGDSQGAFLEVACDYILVSPSGVYFFELVYDCD